MIGEPQHYLVVDDDKTNNLICELIIRKFDKAAKVGSYLIPEKALLYIEQEYSKTEEPIPTILFLDINMPSMTGFEFLDKFIKFDEVIQDQFAIYILSSSTEDFITEATQYPIVKEFLSKPLTILHLKTIWDQ